MTDNEKFFKMYRALHGCSPAIISDSITVKSNACGHPRKWVSDRRTEIAQRYRHNKIVINEHK